MMARRGVGCVGLRVRLSCPPTPRLRGSCCSTKASKLKRRLSPVYYNKRFASSASSSVVGWQEMSTAPPIVARRAPPPPPRIKKPSQENLNVPDELKQVGMPAFAPPGEPSAPPEPVSSPPAATEGSNGVPRLVPKGPPRGPSISVGGGAKRPLPTPPGVTVGEAPKDPSVSPAPLAQRPLPRPVSMFPGKSPLAARNSSIPAPGTGPPTLLPKPAAVNNSTHTSPESISGGAKKVGRPPSHSVAAPQGISGSPPKMGLPSRPSLRALPIPPGGTTDPSPVGFPAPPSPGFNRNDSPTGTHTQSFAPPSPVSQRPGAWTAPPSNFGPKARPVSAIGSPASLSSSDSSTFSDSHDALGASGRAQTDAELSVNRGRPRSPSFQNSASEASIAPARYVRTFSFARVPQRFFHGGPMGLIGKKILSPAPNR